MKIISWNVNGLRANVRKGGFDWLINSGADIFCLQETKVHPDQLPGGVRQPSSYHAYFDHAKIKSGYSGVAVYTKIEPKKVEYGLGVKELDQEGRFLGLFFEGLPDPKGAGFALFNVYFPNGGAGPERLAFKLRYYDAFLKYLEKIREKEPNIIFCGDINTAHQEIDLARPKENENNTGFLPIERKWLDEVIGKNYIDTFRYFHPNEKTAYTYWDMKTFARDRNVGWRIDYFFVTKEFLPKVNKSEILPDVFSSDHCPIFLEVL
ncbi:MAG: exodeoxyribonuclease III [Patescibacteria group bacterium]